MSNDFDQNNKLILEDVERILSRKNSEEGVPPQLQPKKLHDLYHNLKLQYDDDPNKLKRFEIWEEEVSKRIAKQYFDYKPATFDIESFKSKSNKLDGWIHNRARAVKSQVSSRKIDKVRDYFKNTSHAWLIENVSYRKKDYDSFRKILYDYTLTDEYLKKTHGKVRKKAIRKEYEGIGKSLWTKIHEETKELTRKEVRKKFCDEFGKNYWKEIHEPYLKEIREATNLKQREKFCEVFSEEYWEYIHKEEINKIHKTTGNKAGKKYYEAYDKKQWQVTRKDLENGFRDELVEFFPGLNLVYRKPREGSYISGNAFVMKEYYSRSKKGIVHLVICKLNQITLTLIVVQTLGAGQSRNNSFGQYTQKLSFKMILI